MLTYFQAIYIYNSKDYTYHDLQWLIKNKDIKVLQGEGFFYNNNEQ